jgi:hypothetical protein
MDNLFGGSQLDDRTWSLCSDQAKKDLQSCKDPWVDSYDDWKALSVEDKLLLMARYPMKDSQVTAGADVQSIVDDWRMSDVKKKSHKKQPEATEDWQTVGGAPEDLVKTVSTAEEEADDDEFDEDAFLSRALIDDDDDDNGSYFGDTISRGKPKDLDILLAVIKRKTDMSVATVSKHDRDFLKKSVDVWKLSKEERKRLCTLWASLLNTDADADIHRFSSDCRKAAEVEAKYNARLDTFILKGAKVVGMTTTGAAKYNQMLRTLGPEVIIVEEAAEVLEASIVAALTSNTKHLILIGDHLQLRPQISEYSIGTHHGLEVSLFERLVHLGVKHVTLTNQRRMHPDISALITPSIYKMLGNAGNVESYPPVTGVSERLYFISHDIPEDGENKVGSKVKAIDMAHDENGKCNDHEANYIVRLLVYLLCNGYKTSQVVVLSMYKRQVFKIKSLAKAQQR